MVADTVPGGKFLKNKFEDQSMTFINRTRYFVFLEHKF